MDRRDRSLTLTAKLSRADTHLEELKSAVDGFMQEQVHRVAVDLKAEKGYAVVFAAALGFQRTRNWGIIIGDIVHSWRSTLDHLAHSLACLVEDPPSCKTEFPIFWQPKRFARNGKGKIACLAPEDQIVIESFQPYSPVHGTPDDPKAHPLWLLQEMNISDKHKLLNVTAVTASFRKLTPINVRDLEIVGLTEYPRADNLEYGTVLARYQIQETGQNPEMDVQAEGTYGVVFGEGSPAPNKGCFHTLYAIRSSVWEVVTALRTRFEPY